MAKCRTTATATHCNPGEPLGRVTIRRTDGEAIYQNTAATASCSWYRCSRSWDRRIISSTSMATATGLSAWRAAATASSSGSLAVVGGCVCRPCRSSRCLVTGSAPRAGIFSIILPEKLPLQPRRALHNRVFCRPSVDGRFAIFDRPWPERDGGYLILSFLGFCCWSSGRSFFSRKLTRAASLLVPVQLRAGLGVLPAAGVSWLLIFSTDSNNPAISSGAVHAPRSRSSLATAGWR